MTFYLQEKDTSAVSQAVGQPTAIVYSLNHGLNTKYNVQFEVSKNIDSLDDQCSENSDNVHSKVSFVDLMCE